MNKRQREIQDLLERFGLKVAEADITAKGHYKLKLEAPNGYQKTFILAKEHGDVRAWKNEAAEIKRFWAANKSALGMAINVAKKKVTVEDLDMKLSNLPPPLVHESPPFAGNAVSDTLFDPDKIVNQPAATAELGPVERAFVEASTPVPPREPISIAKWTSRSPAPADNLKNVAVEKVATPPKPSTQEKSTMPPSEKPNALAKLDLPKVVPGTRRDFDDAKKREIIRAVKAEIKGGKFFERAASELDIAGSVLRRWAREMGEPFDARKKAAEAKKRVAKTERTLRKLDYKEMRQLEDWLKVPARLDKYITHIDLAKLATTDLKFDVSPSSISYMLHALNLEIPPAERGVRALKSNKDVQVVASALADLLLELGKSPPQSLLDIIGPKTSQ